MSEHIKWEDIKNWRKDMHVPELEMHGDIAFHDMACPVCQKHKASYDLNTGIFHPCGDCHIKGWELTKVNWFKRNLSLSRLEKWIGF